MEENVDLALRIGRLSDSSLIARRLFGVRSMVCASPHYLATHGEPATPEDLKDHDCLVYSNLADLDHWSYQDTNGDDRRVKINRVMTSSSGDFLTNAASHGLGIVIQPTFISADAIRKGHLVPILRDVAWPQSSAWAVYPPTRHLSFRVRAFIDFLAERFAGTPQWDRDCESDADPVLVG